MTTISSPSSLLLLPTVQHATWPEACPSDQDEGFLSVISGNTHCKFAFHQGKDYLPTCFWRIPVSSDANKNKDSFLESIPQQSREAQALWKHPSNDDTNDTTTTALTRPSIHHYRVTTKRYPIISIYFISTNPVHEETLLLWFQGLPVRFIRLQQPDVLQASSSSSTPPRITQIPYPTLGMDRLVAAQAVPTFPALIIDGGTALTTTVVDASGSIVGGTISPGFYAQCRALHMGHLPWLSPNDLEQFVNRTEPLPLFATNTNDAMWNGIVRSVALYLQSVVRTFVQGLDERSTPRVIVTGSDGPLLMKLLDAEQCHTLLADMPRDFMKDVVVEMEYSPHLLHHGITQILLQHRGGVDPCLEWVGLRVARDVGNGYVDQVEHRTTDIRWDDALFHIVYDNGHTNVLQAPAFYDALVRYSVNGETSTTIPTIHSSAVAQKQKDSEQAAAQLAERCRSVAEHKEGRLQSPLIYHPQQAIVETVSTNDAQPSVARKRGRPRTRTPSAKKIDRRTKQNRNRLPDGVEPTDYISRRVAKFFGDEEVPFFGSVISYNPDDQFWKIQYEDGDQEDMEFYELVVQMKCFEENIE